ncbi:polysaccharide pyruvyl transferase family protein [Mycolicibacterium sphagni]|uniref:polysaccharide pyruvyl transferase family protein n=1 Tax=Mycolicibacterium sphagni TaxID=1786 RepID=UPI0021F283B2|nr:polysaccharide pyruvyl transferase family protein [Mycolicibacterium sphagni]MCV7177491.1 polysaccharide pyruvyl transferase family protein [Mycolicibacterium sphagni]
MKSAIFGTFDIGNFGDLMFPIIAERKLSEFGHVDMTRFSYRGKRADSWYYDVEAIQNFPEHVGDTSLVIVGGGHLVHFDRLMSQGYYPTDRRIPHPLGFWWVPALAARMAGIPAALNAVSVASQIPRWAEPLMGSFLDSLDYVAVRDSQSKMLLRRYAAGDVDINVVPDTVHSVPDLIERGVHSDKFTKFLAATGMGSDYIIVQPSDGFRRYGDTVEAMISDALAQGLDVLELPIFNEVVDSAGSSRFSQAVKHADEWPEPILLAEIIANAQSVIGISLHLSIVASAYGIPVHRPSYSRESKFVALDGLPNISFLDSSPNLSLRNPDRVDLSEVERRRSALNEHWRRIHDLAQDCATARRPVGWDLILQTPSAFRRAGGIRDKVETMRLETRRRGHFVAHAIRTRSFP